MTHLLGDADPPLAALAQRSGARERAARLAGTYRDYHHTRSDMSRIRALMPMIQARLTVDGDGALAMARPAVAGGRAVRVPPRGRGRVHRLPHGRARRRRRTSQQQRHLRAHRLAGANRLSRCLTHRVHGGLRGVRRVPAGGPAPAPAREDSPHGRALARRTDGTAACCVRRHDEPALPAPAGTVAPGVGRRHAAALADGVDPLAAARQPRGNSPAAGLRRTRVERRLVDTT